MLWVPVYLFLQPNIFKFVDRLENRMLWYYKSVIEIAHLHDMQYHAHCEVHVSISGERERKWVSRQTTQRQAKTRPHLVVTSCLPPFSVVHFWKLLQTPMNGSKSRKSIFSYGNLFFRTATWVAQVVTQILRPTDLVYDFSFPSYARFREGTRPMPQKVFPHPTVRAPSASNSPSALSARALRARARSARAG